MLRAFFLTTCAVVVLARTSPHADKLNELYRSLDGSQFSKDILEDALLDVPGLIAKYKYPVEVHNVVTSDGYILEMHRIPHGRDNNNDPSVTRPVAFVMHGLLSSSADFITMTPGYALGYHLAEAGYDVWLGNARGNYYSRKHISRNPDTNDFWKFSWDEIGNYDLAAFVDYVLAVTGQPKVHYIGHSQGGTSFLVLNSLRPEYNDKFYSFQGLAPASYFTYNENRMFNALAPYEAVIETAAWAMGIGEIFGDSDFTAWLKEKFCEDDSSSMFESLCSGSLSSVLDMEYFNATMMPVLLAHAPAGASVRQVSHYGQVIRFDSFRRYNYPLTLSNLAAYGRLYPPEYDLSKVTVPTYLHYGLADQEVDYRDLLKLADNMPNVIKANKMTRDSFNHFDFIWGIDATEQVYYSMVDYMQEAQRNA